MMFRESYDRLVKSKAYKDWRKQCPDSYLAYGFLIIEDSNKIDSWEIGFYNKEDEKLDTFAVDNHKIELKRQKEEVFKKPDTEVCELKPDFEIDIITALKAAKALQEKEYPKQKLIKAIVILQHIDEATVYNISYITEGLNTLNIKVNADNADIVEHKLVSIFEFRGKE